jgi:ferredoxin
MEAGDLQRLIDVLNAQQYHVIGPVLRDGAVVYDDLVNVADLPAGWRDEQAGGHYRLVPRDDDAYFGYAVGPHTWKRLLFPPERRLWRAERAAGDAFRVHVDHEDPPRRAFLGVRPCELAAIAIQDRIFMQGAFVDPVYAGLRKNTLLVVVQCAYASATCFCTSMGTGPQAASGYDLALTEILDEERHTFFVEAGTDAGRVVLEALALRPATASDRAAARAVVARTAASIERTLKTDDLHDVLLGRPNHPHWDEIAARCLSCANCTLVCPTCFCSTVEDVTDLSGTTAERWQKWDSCFTLDFSYIHGGSVRTTVMSRYRQWLTHKLASWIDQFGTSGCVGCGRCIAWCPVGIDLTEEVPRLRDGVSAAAASPENA